MTVSPENELMVLLACADDNFTDTVDNFEWNAAHPGESEHIDLICEFERQGWVTLCEERDPDRDRMLKRARLAPPGHSRIKELLDAGVEPAPPIDADDEVP